MFDFLQRTNEDKRGKKIVFRIVQDSGKFDTPFECMQKMDEVIKNWKVIWDDLPDGDGYTLEDPNIGLTKTSLLLTIAGYCCVAIDNIRTFSTDVTPKRKANE